MMFHSMVKTLVTACGLYHGQQKERSRFGFAFLWLTLIFCSLSSGYVAAEGAALARLQVLEQAYAKSAENPVLAAQLATAYIQYARDESDPAYYRKANAVIKPWVKRPKIPGVRKKDIPNELRLVRATLAQHDHEYAAATEDLLFIVRQQPKNIQSWLTLSTIQLVQGDYQKAEASCSVLGRIASRWLSALCYSQLYALTGSAERGYTLQQSLLTQLAPEQTELRLWVIGLLAENAMRRGLIKQAEQHFKAGLELKDNDTYILRTFSEFLLAQNRSQEVVELLKEHQTEDQLLLRLALAFKAQGDTDELGRVAALLEQRFADAIAVHGHAHDRDAALFLLEFKPDNAKNKAQVLQLALANWETQKEPDDALLLLRAALNSQQPSAVTVVHDWVEKNKLEDRRLQRLLDARSAAS